MRAMWRPVDRFRRPRGFKHTRLEALALGVCCRCGSAVDVGRLHRVDADEYAISALCPRCYDEMTAAWEGI